MLKRGIRFLLIFICSTQLSCSVNILEEFGDPDTDMAKYHEANRLISKGMYSDALTVFSTMSANFLTKPEVIQLRASANAGLCGLDFLNFVTEISNIGTTKLYQLLMAGRASIAPDTNNITYCSTAISLIQSLGATGATRTDDENIFLAAVAFIQMGVIFSVYADTDNNGTLDGGFDACAGGSIADAQIDQYGAALMIAIESINAITNPAFGGAEASTVNTVCATLAGAPYNETDICTKTDGSFDATERNLLRSLIKESSAVGLAQCTGDISTCFCP